MVTRVYRRTPFTTHGKFLGYVDHDRDARTNTRYTPTGEVIDIFSFDVDFDQWFRRYNQFWTTNPNQAYFIADPDLLMDEGL